MMKRRTLLQLGFGGAAVLALGGVASIQPGLEGARLAIAGRTVFRAVARAVLDGMLPAQPVARAAALEAHQQRLDVTIAGLSATSRAELSQLLALLGTAVGRRALASLSASWNDASIAELQAALQSMRTSSLELRQQAYHALRDLINAAYFADPGTWSQIGYPGPSPI